MLPSAGDDSNETELTVVIKSGTDISTFVNGVEMCIAPDKPSRMFILEIGQVICFGKFTYSTTVSIRHIGLNDRLLHVPGESAVHAVETSLHDSWPGSKSLKLPFLFRVQHTCPMFSVM